MLESIQEADRVHLSLGPKEGMQEEARLAEMRHNTQKFVGLLLSCENMDAHQFNACITIMIQ
jgi:hypothetical protein